MKVDSVEDVVRIFNEIAEISRDDEAAHGMEDDLHFEVLCYIAQFSTEDKIRKMAFEATQTANLDFSRWCA